MFIGILNILKPRVACAAELSQEVVVVLFSFDRCFDLLDLWEVAPEHRMEV